MSKVCYTRIKLENKINNLTNNKNKNKGKQKMTETLNLPKKVINSDWKDDIDYETYGDEKTYISPDEVSRESINKIKSRKLNQERGHKVFLFTKNAKLFA